MSPRVYRASGGQGKLFFMQSCHSLLDFSVNNNSILTRLLWDLKKTLAVRHLHHPSKSSDSELDPMHPLAIKVETEGHGTLKTGKATWTLS